MKPARYLIVSAVCIAAIGIALARGRKADDAPIPTPVATPVEPELPPAPPAPKLFDGQLPLDVSVLPAGLSSLSAQSCAGCHPAAVHTWRGSGHHGGWSGAAMQSALASAGDSTACQSCHLPLQAQHAEIAVGYVDGAASRPQLVANSAFDLTLRGEGVTCAACHIRTLADGSATVIGSRASTNSPHPVMASPELAQSEMCASCHELSWPGGDQPFYATYSEWKASGWGKAGVTCQGCHMTDDGQMPGSDGVSHRIVADTGRALTALVRAPGTLHRNAPFDLTLTLQNTGAGHSLPTGNPARRLVVTVAVLDAQGKELAPSWVQTFGRTVEQAPPYRTVSDTRIAAGGQTTGSHAFTPSAKGTPGMGHIEVRTAEGTGKDAVTTVIARSPVRVE